MTDKNEHNIANETKWSRRADTYDDKRFNYFRFMQKELISIIQPKPNIKFLDLGCGTGWAVCYVANSVNGKGKFIGVDISKKMIEKAKINATDIKNVEFYENSVDNLPIKDNYIDIAICSNSFHHYLYPNKVLNEIKRVLRPNGTINILDITADDFFIRWIDRNTKRREKEHVQFYGTEDYARMFQQAGLRHIQSKRVKIFYPLKIHIGKKEI